MSNELKPNQWLTPVGRFSHPHVFKAQAIKPGAPEYYSVELLLPKDEVKKSEIERPLLVAAKAKWGDNPKEWPQLKLPFRDGDKPHGKKKEVKPEYKGMWVIKASTKAEYGKPSVVDGKRKAIDAESGLFYPGCFGRIFVMASAYTNPEKDGVSFILDGVQKTRDGNALGGKKPIDQMFGVIEDDILPDSPEGDTAFGFPGEDEAGVESDDGEGFF